MEHIFDLLSKLSIPIGVVVMIFIQYRLQSPKVAGEVINNYDTLVKQIKDQKIDLEKKLDEQATKHSAEMNALHKQIGEKDGIIKMQDKIIEQQKATIENRNPELEKVLSEIRDFLKTIFPLIKETHDSSQENKDELLKQTTILESGKEVELVGKIVPKI